MKPKLQQKNSIYIKILINYITIINNTKITHKHTYTNPKCINPTEILNRWTKCKGYLKILFSWSSTSLPGNKGRPAFASSKKKLDRKRNSHTIRKVTTKM